jgi:hypothetical protein
MNAESDRSDPADAADFASDVPPAVRSKVTGFIKALHDWEVAAAQAAETDDSAAMDAAESAYMSLVRNWCVPGVTPQPVSYGSDPSHSPDTEHLLGAATADDHCSVRTRHTKSSGFSSDYEYHLRLVGGEWLIENLFYVDGCEKCPPQLRDALRRWVIASCSPRWTPSLRWRSDRLLWVWMERSGETAVMRVRNVHERRFCAEAPVGELIDSLTSNRDLLWPTANWPRMKLDRGLAVGSAGGHGPIRYSVEAYAAGSSIRFRFSSPTGFDGWHGYSVTRLGDQTVVLQHAIEMAISGFALLTWPLVYRPLHDALMEDSMACAQAAVGDRPQMRRWTLWVRLLRKLLARGRR